MFRSLGQDMFATCTFTVLVCLSSIEFLFSFKEWGQSVYMYTTEKYMYVGTGKLLGQPLPRAGWQFGGWGEGKESARGTIGSAPSFSPLFLHPSPSRKPLRGERGVI